MADIYEAPAAIERPDLQASLLHEVTEEEQRRTFMERAYLTGRSAVAAVAAAAAFGAAAFGIVEAASAKTSHKKPVGISAKEDVRLLYDIVNLDNRLSDGDDEAMRPTYTFINSQGYTISGSCKKTAVALGGGRPTLRELKVTHDAGTDYGCPWLKPSYKLYGKINPPNKDDFFLNLAAKFGGRALKVAEPKLKQSTVAKLNKATSYAATPKWAHVYFDTKAADSNQRYELTFVAGKKPRLEAVKPKAA